MKIKILTFLLLIQLITINVYMIPDVAHGQSEYVASNTEDIQPLSVGEMIPSLTLEDADGNAFDMNEAIKKQPAVVIFYRGGWCPYCNLQLGQLQTVEPNLLELGYQILAISPDRPKKLTESSDKQHLTYTLLSDSTMKAAKAFGIAFRVDDETINKYRGYGIDLEAASGQTHHLLPVPAVFIVGTDGTIHFSYTNPDYKVRLSPDELLKAAQAAIPSATNKVEQILSRIRKHDFHPIRDGFTFDRHLDKHGVANLQDIDWRVRLLAVRDLVRLGSDASRFLIEALSDDNTHVRQVVAMVLGILRQKNAVPALETSLQKDSDFVVRSQAAIALGQIADKDSLEVLRRIQTEDTSRDVQHQAELAAYAVEHGLGATPELAAAYRDMDETRFSKARVGQQAIDFELPDTEGKVWRLSDFHGKKPVVLIWIFADWCPVCHGEFNELIELEDAFQDPDIEVVTLECHDIFPARVMVGKELEPKYWFSKTSFKESYTKSIWWPHLVDRAGSVGAMYGVQPLAFVVHSEWINRPSVVIVDKEGIVRFAYYGTFWGDRPSIHQVLEMLKSNQFGFESDKRLKVKDQNLEKANEIYEKDN
ncbi:MAG: redoxin domain-containing protein [Planctomycetes bacterium]|nr:redoxin domain-containing protein [Planctomycetota bacterium]MBL7107067.1 redoxin domain-containing protein [Phycisphaerae bacterium]